MLTQDNLAWFLREIFLLSFLIDNFADQVTSSATSAQEVIHICPEDVQLKSINDFSISMIVICLLESSLARLQELTDTTTAAEDVGRIISVNRTEYMIVKCRPKDGL